VRARKEGRKERERRSATVKRKEGRKDGKDENAHQLPPFTPPHTLRPSAPPLPTPHIQLDPVPSLALLDVPDRVSLRTGFDEFFDERFEADGGLFFGEDREGGIVAEMD
jgi:hypothetical protein